jgi:catechol 2,3-dioxygenase-like lactoylglutathione lyase family enzyme
MRIFDHVVLPVADLAVARARYADLGFTVAPDGIHPFGTANCCVFLKDGGFLEPLALNNEALRDEVLAKSGDAAFIQTHASYVQSQGAEGFSHLVLRSNDASVDRAEFQKHGISSGTTHFERIAQNGGGQSQQVAFDLSFASDTQSPDAYFFTCHSLRALEIDVLPLKTHANGVTGISHIYSAAQNPHDHTEFARDFIGSIPDAGETHLSADLGNLVWLVDMPEKIAAYLGTEIDGMRHGTQDMKRSGMKHCAIAFRTSDIAFTRRYFDRSDVSYTDVNGLIVVPPAAGQGYWMVFGGG